MPPHASIVVATHNRAPSLKRLLDALAAQDTDVPFEVVVVDDASTDDTTEVLREATAGGSLDLQVLRLDANSGPATARNLGWRAASSALVCFTDDDCTPRPNWVATMLDNRGADIIQGRTIPAPSQAQDRGPFSHTMNVPREDGLYSTCNIAYRRSVLDGVGGFDEAFRMAYGEDTDLAWRAIGAGATTAFAADAIVEHDIRRSTFRDHLRGLRRREGLVHTVHKHPGVRRLLPYRGYVHPPHLRLVVLLAATTILVGAPSSAPRWMGALVAGAWYAHGCRRYRTGPPNKWAWFPALPFAFVADVVELSVFVRASVRYREVVL